MRSEVIGKGEDIASLNLTDINQADIDLSDLQRRVLSPNR